MANRETFMKIARFAGIGLTCASLVFLGERIYQQSGAIMEIQWNASGLAALAGAVLLSAANLLFFSLSWALLLRDRSEPRNKLLSAISVYASSSIMKYLPGNVFHYVARNIAGGKLGKSQGHLAAASVFEIMFSLLSAMFLPAIIFLFVPAPFFQELFRLCAIAFSLVLLGLLFFPQMFERLASLLPASLSITWLPKNIPSAMLSNIAGFVSIMCGAALLGYFILPQEVSPFSAGALFIMAWMVGFVTIGAPGGVGVREAFLVMVLTPLSGGPDALVFAILMRMATTLGDVMLYFTGPIIQAAVIRLERQT